MKQAELERALKKLNNGGDPIQVAEQLARDLTNKIAHHPSQVIKQADIDGNQNIITAARKLFNL